MASGTISASRRRVAVGDGQVELVEEAAGDRLGGGAGQRRRGSGLRAAFVEEVDQLLDAPRRSGAGPSPLPVRTSTTVKWVTRSSSPR